MWGCDGIKMMSSDKESDIVIASRIIAEAIENLSTSVDTLAENVRDHELPDLSDIASAIKGLGAFTDVFHQVEDQGSLRIKND